MTICCMCYVFSAYPFGCDCGHCHGASNRRSWSATDYADGWRFICPQLCPQQINDKPDAGVVVPTFGMPTTAFPALSVLLPETSCIRWEFGNEVMTRSTEKTSGYCSCQFVGDRMLLAGHDIRQPLQVIHVRSE